MDRRACCTFLLIRLSRTTTTEEDHHRRHSPAVDSFLSSLFSLGYLSILKRHRRDGEEKLCLSLWRRSMSLAMPRSRSSEEQIFENDSGRSITRLLTFRGEKGVLVAQGKRKRKRVINCFWWIGEWMFDSWWFPSLLDRVARWENRIVRQWRNIDILPESF